MDFGNLFSGSWLPKLGAAMAAAGIGIATINPFWGMIVGQVGGFIVGISTRQNNKSSEDIGIKAPEVVVMVEPPVVKVIPKPRGGQK